MNKTTSENTRVFGEIGLDRERRRLRLLARRLLGWLLGGEPVTRPPLQPAWVPVEAESVWPPNS